ncbi:phage tail tube protein [Nocardioides marmoraquaticus]
MAAPARPAGTKAYLRVKRIFIPAVAGAAGPTVAESTGASALDVTNMFYDSSARPSQTTNMARAPKREGDAETYEFVGETQATYGEVRYAHNPQAATGSPGRKAFETFPPGTTGWIEERWGMNRDIDIAAGQKVELIPVEFGPQIITREGDGEGAEVAIQQAIAQTGPRRSDVAVLA